MQSVNGYTPDIMFGGYDKILNTTKTSRVTISIDGKIVYDWSAQNFSQKFNHIDVAIPSNKVEEILDAMKNGKTLKYRMSTVNDAYDVNIENTDAMVSWLQAK